MTLIEAKAVLAEHGMTLTKRDGEYRVNFRLSGTEDTAYYTENLEDAVLTGKAMCKFLWRA